MFLSFTKHIVHRNPMDGLPDGPWIDLEVTSFHGKRLQLCVPRGLSGWQLQQQILQRLSRPGRAQLEIS